MHAVPCPSLHAICISKYTDVDANQALTQDRTALVCCSGYGYGGGIRIDSPLGPVRLEYAWNDQRKGRFHVALGYD